MLYDDDDITEDDIICSAHPATWQVQQAQQAMEDAEAQYVNALEVAEAALRRDVAKIARQTGETAGQVLARWRAEGRPWEMLLQTREAAQ